MPKVLIIDPTVVNFGDDRGGVHQNPADLPEVNKDVARALVQAGRALYASRKDDPTRGGIHTATPDMLKAAEAVRAARTGPKSSPRKAQSGKDDQTPSATQGGQDDPATPSE